jgi:hypothetical protein
MTDVKPEDAAALVVVEDGETDMPETKLAETSQSLALLETEAARARAELEIAQLREEIEQLNGRLTVFRARWTATITPRSMQVSASAHAQLGDIPWLKLFAVASLAWLGGRLIRR